MLRRASAAATALAAAGLIVAVPFVVSPANAVDEPTPPQAAATPGYATDSGTGCGNRVIYHPFTYIGDDNPYYLVSGGDFEGYPNRWFGTGYWRVQENEPWKVGGSQDTTSAYLSRTGATASAPSMCVSVDEPTVRFYYKAPGTPGARMHVKLRTTSSVASHLKTVVIDGSTPGWQLSDPISITNSTDSTGTQNLLLDFVSQGGAWNIDDVYVDPWKYTVK